MDGKENKYRREESKIAVRMSAKVLSNHTINCLPKIPIIYAMNEYICIV